MSELDDMYGEAAVHQGLKKQKEKSLSSGQGSLFFDEFIKPDTNPNYENMKKEAVKKANTKAEEHEAAKNARRAAKGGGSGSIHVKGAATNPNFDMKKGGKVKSASQRADGCCIRGKTRA